MNKAILALLMLAALALLMTGCAANANGLGTTMTPIATHTPMIAATIEPTGEPTAMPMATEQPVAMTPMQSGKLAERIAESVARISEINEAEAFVHNERAVVAVRFEDQYKAGLDERMKQMIVGKVQEIDKTLTDVQITDDDTLYGQIKNLGERLAQATGMDELADDFGDLWDRIVGR